MLLAQPCFSRIPLEVQKEMRETELKIEGLQKLNKSSEVPAAEEVELLKNYLKSLEIINQLSNQSCNLPSPTPHNDTLTLERKFLQTLEQLDKVYKSDISPSEVYKLIHYVESNKEQWRMRNTQIKPFTIKSKSGEVTQVHFSIDRQDRIYLQFGSIALGRGASKVAYKITSYGSWSNLVKLALRPDIKEPDTKEKNENFANEQKILGRISDLPRNEQTGLVETYHVGRKQIIQSMYPYALSAIRPEVMRNLRSDLRLDLIHQLSIGLRKLHDLGIHHTDLKQENILVNLESQEPKLAISDFDLAYFPQYLIRSMKKRPLRGTPVMMAPEMIKMIGYPQKTTSWEGADEKEKIEIVFKSDVYAAATIAYEIMNPYGQNWIKKCENILIFYSSNEYSDEYKDFFTCQVHALKNFIYQESESLNLDSFNHLIAAAVKPDPAQRINSKQFDEGIKYLQEKSYSPQNDPGPVPERLLISKYQKYGQPDYVKLREVEAENLLMGKSPGSYIVHKIKFNKGFRMGFTFITQDGSPKTKVLEINSLEPLELEKEINFLKMLGTLKSLISV